MPVSRTPEASRTWGGSGSRIPSSMARPKDVSMKASRKVVAKPLQVNRLGIVGGQPIFGLVRIRFNCFTNTARHEGHEKRGHYGD